MRVPAVQSRPVYERPGYRTLLGRIRENVRTYIRKQLALPRQEIAEILAANKRAAMWLGVAAGLAFMTLITLVFFIVALVALIPTLLLAVWKVSSFDGFGGTSLLIAVGVALETMKQIDSQLMMRNYEGFLA